MTSIHPPQKLPLDARSSTFSDLEPLELAFSHMPKWLVDADPHIITELNEAMAQSRAFHGRIGKKFGQLQSIEVFCGSLLSAESRREFGPLVDVHRDYLAAVHVQLVTDQTLMSTVRRHWIHDEPKTLLWAALQNFSESEALVGGFNSQSHIRHGGNPDQISAVQPWQFAALCRRLDLGQKYQTYLQQFLGVAPTGVTSLNDVQRTTQINLQRLKAYDMQVDAHIAFLKKNIGRTAYDAILAVLLNSTSMSSVNPVALDGRPVILSSISILDTVIDGVLIFTSDTPLLHPHNRLIVYIPNDPVAPFYEYSSLQALTDALKERLLDSAYVTFFSRFVALSERRIHA